MPNVPSRYELPLVISIMLPIGIVDGVTVGSGDPLLSHYSPLSLQLSHTYKYHTDTSLLYNNGGPASHQSATLHGAKSLENESENRA